MQHEMWKQLCISLSMTVSKIEHSGNGKFNTNCGGSCARCCICVFNSSELMVVGNATRIVKAVVYLVVNGSVEN